MNRKMGITIALTLGALTLALAFNNCQRVVYKYHNSDSSQGGIGGNPMVSKTVLSAICSTVNRCHPEVPLNTCEEGILPTDGFAVPLGLSTSYTTFDSILTAESAGTLSGNTSAGESCYTQVNSLDCSDPNVVGAYNSTSLNPFSAAPSMIPPGVCGQVFAPGVNLEVPIELVDRGIGSTTTTTMFARSTTNFDTTDYDGVSSYNFEVVATNEDSMIKNVSLINSAGNPNAQIAIPANTTNPTRIRSAFNPTLGANSYKIRLDATSANGKVKIYTARLLVKQVGATKTKIYVPLTSGYSLEASSADNTTAAIDDAIFGSGLYQQDNPHYFSLWRKNSAAFDSIVNYTLEAVISSSAGATGFASLFNAISGRPVTGTEVSTGSTTPQLVTATFADNATNFSDLDTFEVKIKNSGSSSNTWVYRAGLWIKLDGLKRGEVYYRYGKTAWLNGSNATKKWTGDIIWPDISAFSAPQTFQEASGYTNNVNYTCTDRIFDLGLLDSGTNGQLVGGSSLLFNTITKTLKRSAVNLTAGHRFISDNISSAGDGSDCIIVQPKLIIRF